MKKSIAFFNRKGGVGKTTSLINIASILAVEYDEKVLIVDCDSQCNATKFCLSGEMGEMNILDFVHKNARVLDIADDATFDSKGGAVVIVPGSVQIDDDEERIEDKEIFRKLIKEADMFDYVLFDCPGSYHRTTECVLNAVDYVIVPANGEMYSIDGYGILLDKVNKIRKTNNKLTIIGLFMNRVDNVNAQKEIIKVAREQFGWVMMRNSIRRTTIVDQSNVLYEPLIIYKPYADVTRDFVKLTEEMLTRIDDDSERR